MSKPAWQTSDLDEEWIDDPLHSSGDSHNASPSLTQSLVVHGSFPPEDVDSPDYSHVFQPSSPSRGTFQIREDQPAAPIGHLLERKNKTRNALKDFFTPLALETMFNPPSPNQSQLATNSDPNPFPDTSHSATSTACAGEGQINGVVMGIEERGHVIVAADIPNLVAFEKPKTSTNYQFTFSAVHPAEGSAPLPVLRPSAPATDPRLRLFQFQYDTFTREHLSAMVDSIAVQASDSSKSFSPQMPPQDPRCHETVHPDLRAPKRLKLTPPEDICVNQFHKNSKPRKDYLGESKSLMQKIKEARSPSMMTILAEPWDSHQEKNDDANKLNGRDYYMNPHSFWSSDSCSALISSNSKSTSNSFIPSSCLQPSAVQNTLSLHTIFPVSNSTPSLPSSLNSSTQETQPRPSTYRRQAVDLMAQIRSDMTKGRRLFSSETNGEIPFHSEVINKGSAVQVSVIPASPESANIVKHCSANADLVSFPEKQHKSIRPSPRKLLRRLSAADEVDRELALNKSASETSLAVDLSEPPSTTADKLPPSIPFSVSNDREFNPSIHPRQNTNNSNIINPNPKFLLPRTNEINLDKSNRKTSSGTTTSIETVDSVLTRATTATSSTSLFTTRSVSAGSADSAASFVKHAGPVQITRITPDDLPLPELVGGMRFDRSLMRWVKAHSKKTGDEGGAPTVVSEESDDPFRDIESIHSGKLDEVVEPPNKPFRNAEESDADMNNDQGNGAAMNATAANVLSMDSDTDDSFDLDYGSEAIVDVMTGEESHETISEFIDYEADDLQADSDHLEEKEEATIIASSHRFLEMQSSAVIVVDLPQLNTPPPAHRSNIPPRSVLKNGAGSNKSTPQTVTPHASYFHGHRRSVSFSDGRKDGKIQGLAWHEIDNDVVSSVHPILPSNISAPATPSIRGERIAAILDDLGNLYLEDELPNTQKDDFALTPFESGPLLPLETFFCREKGAEASTNGQSNHTRLTECSFGISHDKLVHIITDIHPYLPHWERLKEIDLTGKSIESVARIKELLPQLNKIYLDHNRLSWLSGLPISMRTLSISSNLLSSLTSFNQLTNLECLDISNNEIESLKQLSCLKHLRELRADENKIACLEGLEELDGLVKLSLKGNKIAHVNFEGLHWSKLELLNISRNELRSIKGLHTLASLSALNLDHNQLTCLEPERTMPRLHTLRISNNYITQLESGRCCNLRLLYADNNRLAKIHGLEKLKKLESLSLRNQKAQLALSMKDIRDVKRLYLSGNSLPSSFLQEPCYNLIYLELAGCRLTSLPYNLSRLIPNIRVLNLNYNFLTDTRAFDGLTRLRKLTLIGSRLKGTKSLIRVLKKMPDIEMLDFRMNPCTLGWYLPILVQDAPSILQPSEDQLYSADDIRNGPRSGNRKQNLNHKKNGTVSISRSQAQSWQELDAKFRGDLPDDAYVGRLAYRGLVMRACSKIRMLDGVPVSAGEKAKAEQLLRDVLAAKRATNA